MSEITPELTEAMKAAYQNGIYVGAIVGLVVGAVLMLAFICIAEKPLKFKSAPGFRPKNRMDALGRPLTGQQVSELAAAKELLRRHGYRI
ncbi:MAG: hypothetical protein KGL39_42570 [Patescibacteria group bacterium]|nr:hypothetical protein [Patescibacteria group bacterium]